MNSYVNYKMNSSLDWEFDKEIRYQLGSIVTYRGVLYKSLTNLNSEVPMSSPNWIRL